jgi:hypothetical protein
LGIGASEARRTINQLIRFGEIRRLGKDSFIRVRGQRTARSRFSKSSLDRYVEQLLDKAKRLVVDPELNKNFFASQTFALDKNQHALICGLMERLLGEVKEIAEEGKEKTEVYHLGTFLIQLSKK